MIKTKIVHTNNNGDIEYKVLNDTDYFIKAIGWCLVFLLACLFVFLFRNGLFPLFLILFPAFLHYVLLPFSDLCIAVVAY